jgi:hypothetical protein
MERVYELPDGSIGIVYATMTWGEAVIIVLLVALVALKVYELWVSLHHD